MAKKISGSEKFNEFYVNTWGERWRGLKKSLLEQKVKTYRKNGFINPKTKSSEVIPSCYDKEELSNELGLEHFYYMDLASVIAAKNLKVSKGSKVLDLCAAPGGKSLILAEALNGTGELVLNELSRSRRDRLKRVIDSYVPEQLKGNIDIRKYDGIKYGLNLKDEFDFVLLDAPCSSEDHVISKEAELDKWSVKRTKRLAALQYSLLCSALMTVKPGGEILYSTCSISPLENDGVIEKLLKKKEGQVEVLREYELYGYGEETEYGIAFLPDRDGIGPIYFSRLKKLKV